MKIKPLIGAASRQMTMEESKIFLTAMMSPVLKSEFDKAFSVELGFTGQILESRLSACSNVKITKGLALLLVFLSNGNPGNVVMWAYTMHVIAKQKVGCLPITISDFSEFFPMGVPSEEGLCTTWDAQKDPNNGSNLIDDKANWTDMTAYTMIPDKTLLKKSNNGEKINAREVDRWEVYKLAERKAKEEFMTSGLPEVAPGANDATGSSQL